MADVTVGIDIGTTSIKALAADAEGNVVARARLPHAVRAPGPDVFEHDARAVWWDGVRTALAQVSADHTVAAVTVAAMVPSLCAVDGKGQPISAGLLYGDGRGSSAGGSPADSGELLGFLRWLAQRHPEAAGFWPAQAVANAALVGAGAIDTATAMTAAPVFGPDGWDEAVCASAGVTVDQLPGLVTGTDPVGAVPVGHLDAVDGAGAEGAVVSGGTIDALGEQIVAGADTAGDVLVVCGTTLITWAVVDEWREADGLWTVPHTTPGLTLVGGASNAGGLFLDRVRALVADDGPGAEEGVEPDRVPVWLPYIRGERTPLHDPERRASLVDLDVGHGPGAVARAAYEAAGFVVRHHLDLADVTADRIVATGGGTRSSAWMQALADTTGLPVDVAALPEGAALGAAYMARATAGLEPDLSGAGRWARTDHRVEPRSAWAAACDHRYARFRELTA
ncbi:MAG: FGGY-family carbohydrate kinase, partial [Actinomycetota bacterium]